MYYSVEDEHMKICFSLHFHLFSYFTTPQLYFVNPMGIVALPYKIFCYYNRSNNSYIFTLIILIVAIHLIDNNSRTFSNFSWKIVVH